MRIECNITQRCNAVCEHCNKAVGLANGVLQDMTVDQMRRAVDQIIEQKLPVKRFTFCGGEPIMHPQLQELLNEVARIPRPPLKIIRVLTNGLRKYALKRSAITLPDDRFHWIENPLDDIDDPLSGKNDPKQRPNRRYHLPFWISPADAGYESTFENCTVRSWCGIGLDYSGWSMCGKAALMGTLLGIDPCIRNGDIAAHVATPIPEICRHCQYGMEGKTGRQGQRKHGPVYEIERRHKEGELPSVSETWQAAFDRHARGEDLIQLEVF